jgi:hypothetical protein
MSFKRNDHQTRQRITGETHGVYSYTDNLSRTTLCSQTGQLTAMIGIAVRYFVWPPNDGEPAAQSTTQARELVTLSECLLPYANPGAVRPTESMGVERTQS